MLVNNCVKLLLYPCHKTEEHLRETGELKAGNVSYIFTQYSMDQMQDRETNPNNFYKKTSQIFWQENEGTPKRSYLASVIQQLNDSLVMWCFLVFGSHCVEFWREIFKLSLDKLIYWFCSALVLEWTEIGVLCLLLTSLCNCCFSPWQH